MASPVAQIASQAEIPVLKPASVGERTFVETLESLKPDIGVVAAFGQFLPRSIRELPSRGYLINAHASLLPRYRGAAPIARALLAGESRTGVSVMRVVRDMDAGPVAMRREIEIGETENAAELTDRLARLSADAIEEALEAISLETIRFTEQDASQATSAPKITREDAIIDWRNDARSLERRVRAMAPRPGASTTLQGETLRILEAKVLPAGTDPLSAVAGQVVRDSASALPLRVATGDGWLVPLRVQRGGGRVLDIEAFLRGREIPDRAILGD